MDSNPAFRTMALRGLEQPLTATDSYEPTWEGRSDCPVEPSRSRMQLNTVHAGLSPLLVAGPTLSFGLYEGFITTVPNRSSSCGEPSLSILEKREHLRLIEEDSVLPAHKILVYQVPSTFRASSKAAPRYSTLQDSAVLIFWRNSSNIVTQILSRPRCAMRHKTTNCHRLNTNQLRPPGSSGHPVFLAGLPGRRDS
jgi:hypothetical protein